MRFIKKLLSCIIIPTIIFMAVPFTQVNAESIYVLDTDVTTPSEDCVMLGIKGTYNVNIDEALARINEIRYEACREGVINPKTNTPLTLSDYVPIKWSSDLEYIARIRAAEASVTQHHIRTNGNRCFAIQSPDGVRSYGEVLAWNWTDNMLRGIEQWYSEKEDWVNQNPYAVTGHYTAMIDPNNTYVGLGTFCSNSGEYYNTTAGEFLPGKFLSGSANLDGTHGTAVKNCIQKLEVSKSALDGEPSIKGNVQLKPGESSTLNLFTNVKYDDGSGTDLLIMDSSWKSSDNSIVSIESSGNGSCKIKVIKCGKAVITASANGQNYTKTIDVKHSYTSKVTKQPTCTETGTITYTCECGSAYTETIAASGHKYTATVVNPTCTEKGYTVHKCSVCGNTYKDTYTNAKGHSFSSWKTTKNATCTTSGTQERKCSLCGKTETKEIAASGHKYTATVVNPTCTEKGYTVHKCSVCGDSYKDNYKNVSGHSYKNITVKSTCFAKGYTARKCSVCGYITGKKYTSMLVMSAPKASVSSKSIKLSWNKVSGAKGYEVYQYKNNTWTKIKTTTSTSYTVTNLLSGTSQKFAIKPYSVSGGKTVYGSLSKQLYTSTNPVTVNFSLTSGTGKATVKWNKVTGASGYKIYYKTSKNGSWQTLKTVNNKTTSYTKTGLTKNKVYYFTVRAYRIVDGKTYYGGYVTKSIKIR
ncbi:MAG: CAP domain-containing protein [Clostridia bacterium]|nr:CAP domain-containing protein [Clostridia bacterium]